MKNNKLENNRFYQHRKDIQKISVERVVDIGVAARMLAHEMGWSGYQAELNAWEQACVDDQRKAVDGKSALFSE